MDNKKNGIPKLRFPGFTGAWEQRKLGEEFKRVNERNNGEFGKDRWISVAKMYFQDPDKVTSNNIDTRTYVMRLGDIAFEGNSNNEFKFGRFVANDIGDGVVSELFPIYRHIRDYDNNYWKYAIHLERIMRPIFAKSITSSGSSSNKLAPKDLLRQSIFLPNLDEQKKIGAFFINIDSLIALHQRKLEHLQEQKKGLLQKMFPKNGETVPEVRFPGFTDAWEQRKLGEYGYFYYGKSAPKWSVVKEGGTPCIRYGELYTKFNSIVDRVYSRTNIDVNKLKLSKGGEVLVPRVGEDPLDFANCAYLPFPNIAIGEMISVFNTKQNPLFMTYYFNSQLRREFAKRVEGGNVSNLYYAYLENIKMSVPKKEEQDKISTFIKDFDTLISLHQRKLDHLELMKKGLLQQMFV
ncbi:restriction endonuclease subunit S [Ligilactobacillus salivarius]|uniref:restriction endonuclease subunit S n=1 Tax=Ligilactobacillus salivarius TaxID=1624 RepID=UPI0025A3C8B4|nr:restriction endonuclease subunit S [Ligilactobacillus salivarius]MDM8206262.1 restriction endonuclease subunit S [Ligilactobacillus salivarius]